MERDVIRQQLGEIPVSLLGKINDDHEIWEFTDGGAHFKVTRHKLPTDQMDQEFFSLSVSGQPAERERIIQEFSEVLGESAEMTTNHGIDFVLWFTG